MDYVIGVIAAGGISLIVYLFIGAPLQRIEDALERIEDKLE